MKIIMKQLCEQLNGWNFSEEKYNIYFDFYSKDNKAILTMTCYEGLISVNDNVEYYYNDCDYEMITLEDYENKLKRGN